MKLKPVSLAIFFLLINMTGQTKSFGTGSLKVIIGGLKTEKAPVFVAVYKKCKPFPADEAVVSYLKLMPEGLAVNGVFENLPAGEYAIAVFQDLNSNGKLDTGFFGLPKEPYAFSNNFRPRFSAPQFSDCSFVYSGNQKEVAISMIN